MRETGVVRRRVVGDPDLAQRYFGLARTLLGRLKNMLGAGVIGTRNWRLADGAVIRTIVGDGCDIIQVDVRRVSRGGCEEIDAPLTGLLLTQNSEELVLTPQGSGEDATYDVYAKDPATVALFSSTLEPEFYNEHVVDTCGRKEPWYINGIGFANTTWFGGNYKTFPVILSWSGPLPRYGLLQVYGQQAGQFLWSPSLTVYYRGNTIKYDDGTPAGTTFGTTAQLGFATANSCTGAALRRSADGSLHLVYTAAQISATETPDFIEERVYLAPVRKMDHQNILVGDPVQIFAETALYATATASGHAPWLFNSSGTRAVSIRYGTTAGSTANRYFLDVGDASATLTQDKAIFHDLDTTTDATIVTPIELTGYFDNPRPGGPTTTRTRATQKELLDDETLIMELSLADYVGDELVEMELLVTRTSSRQDVRQTTWGTAVSGSFDVVVRTGPYTNNNTYSESYTFAVDGNEVGTIGPFTTNLSYTFEPSTSASGSTTTSGDVLDALLVLAADVRIGLCCFGLRRHNVSASAPIVWNAGVMVEDEVTTDTYTMTHHAAQDGSVLVTAELQTSQTVSSPTDSFLDTTWSASLSDGNYTNVGPTTTVAEADNGPLQSDIYEAQKFTLSTWASYPSGEFMVEIPILNHAQSATTSTRIQYLKNVTDIEVFLEQAASPSTYAPLGSM